MHTNSSVPQNLSNHERTFINLTLGASHGSNFPPRSGTTNVHDHLSHLWKMDNDCNQLMKSTLLMMDTLASEHALPEAKAVAELDKEVQWIALALYELRGVECHTDKTIAAFAQAMICRLGDLKVSLYAFKRILVDRAPTMYDSQPFDTGNLIALL